MAIRRGEVVGARPYAYRVQKRVLVSAAALTGFLVVAALQLALVVVPVLLLLSVMPGRVALRLGLPLCIATVGVMAYATWRALHTRRPEPVGLRVTRDDAPQLWSLLDGAAAAAGTRTPDTVTIVADAAVKIIERTHLLGLVGGRRDLYLGLPLLQAWDAAHLRAVTAHELGHFSPRLGRLAPLAYRGRVAVGRTVPRIPRRNPAGPLLRTYAKFYRRVDAPFSRAQELAADQIAAEHAGPKAAAAVLRDLPALDGIQRVFHAEYLGPGWQAGHVPDDIFGGFLRVLAARAEEIAVLRARDPGAPSTRDIHPPLQERLAALAALMPSPESPSRSSVPADEPAEARFASAAAADQEASSISEARPGDAAGSNGPVGSVGSVGSAGSVGDAGGEVPVAARARPGSLAEMSGQAGSTAPGPAAPGQTTASEPQTPDRPAGERSSGGPPPGQESRAEQPDLVTAGPRAGSVLLDAPAGSVLLDAPAGSVLLDAPAGELVPDLPGLGRALQGVAFPPQGRTTVGWDEFFGAARTVEMQREADAALATISRAAGTPVANAADVLELAADGRLHKAAESVFAGRPADETAGRISELVTLLIALAALRSGAARWRHSWTGTAELVAPDGAHLDLGGLAALAVDPATITTARERLTELGINPAAEPSADGGVSRPEVVGGVVNLVVDGSRTDVLIVDTGLFLVPGLPRSQNGSAKRRLAQFAAADLPQRDAAAPGSRFVPYAEVAAATRTRRKSWDLSLRNGGTLSVRTALDSDELPGGWAALDDAVAFLARTR